MPFTVYVSCATQIELPSVLQDNDLTALAQIELSP